MRQTRVRRSVAAMLALGVAGCTASGGRLGLVGADEALLSTKMLRPGATARSCEVTVLGLAVAGETPSVAKAVQRLLASDAEANVVKNVEVAWERLVTGLYNWSCVTVTGDVARAISTVVLPALGDHSHHGHHAPPH